MLKHNATCDEMKRLIILLKTEIKEFKDRHGLDISHESEIKSQIDNALALRKPIRLWCNVPKLSICLEQQGARMKWLSW